MTGQVQNQLQEGDKGIVDLIVAELRKHEPLLNQFEFPGTINLYLNPKNKACPIVIHIDYKLPGQN